MGITLYYLITGMVPYSPDIEEDIENLFDGKLFLDPDDDPSGEYFNELMKFRNMSEECKDLIRQMLCVDPEQRLSIDDVLSHPWYSLFEDQPIVDEEFRQAFDILNIEKADINE